MATDMRRFTISIPHDLDMALDKAKREIYYKDTQNEMIRDLIMRGLQHLEAEQEGSRNGHPERPQQPQS